MRASLLKLAFVLAFDWAKPFDRTTGLDEVLGVGVIEEPEPPVV